MSAVTVMITDGQARRIASDWHGGMSSALYSLASSGAIDLDRVRDEISRELVQLDVGKVRREIARPGQIRTNDRHAPRTNGMVPLVGRLAGEPGPHLKD